MSEHAAPGDISCECLIIGSGAGGALTAWYLTQRGKDVLVIEEGPDSEAVFADASIARTMPVLWREGGVIPILSNVKLVHAEGRCVGGTTMINAGLIHRIPDEMLASWTRMFRISDLKPELVRKHHALIEKEMRVHAPDTSNNPLSRIFKEGARKCGYRGADTPVAAEEQNGRLRKNDARRTFLRPAIERGARVIANCRAERLSVKKKDAVAVEAVVRDASGNKQVVRIRCANVFICAGAIQTALLLRRSGMGRNVGNSIQFHPTLRVVAEFPEPINAHALAMPSFQIHEFDPEIKLGASVPAPAYVAAALSVNWEENKRHLRMVNNMASFYVATTCASDGQVRNIPLFPGSYFVKYRIHEKAMRNLSVGFSKLAEVLFAAGALRIYPAVEGLASMADLRASGRFSIDMLPPAGLNLVSMHAFSSCPLGENTERCAVDSFGRLHGYHNIYVNDASMLPSSPGVNPQGPLMAMALRNLEANFG